MPLRLQSLAHLFTEDHEPSASEFEPRQRLAHPRSVLTIVSVSFTRYEPANHP